MDVLLGWLVLNEHGTGCRRQLRRTAEQRLEMRGRLEAVQHGIASAFVRKPIRDRLDDHFGQVEGRLGISQWSNEESHAWHSDGCTAERRRCSKDILSATQRGATGKAPRKK